MTNDAYQQRDADVVWQAEGWLTARYGISADAAAAQMEMYAFEHELDLLLLARALVEGRLDPGPSFHPDQGAGPARLLLVVPTDKADQAAELLRHGWHLDPSSVSYDDEDAVFFEVVLAQDEAPGLAHLLTTLLRLDASSVQVV